MSSTSGGVVAEKLYDGGGWFESIVDVTGGWFSTVYRYSTLYTAAGPKAGRLPAAFGMLLECVSSSYDELPASGIGYKADV